MPQPRPSSGVKKKAGPLPVWAWVLVGVLALAAVYVFMRRSKTPAASSPVELVTGARPTAQQTAYGGYPSSATPTQDMISSDVLQQLLAARETPIGGKLNTPVEDLPTGYHASSGAYDPSSRQQGAYYSSGKEYVDYTGNAPPGPVGRGPGFWFYDPNDKAWRSDWVQVMGTRKISGEN